MFRAFENEGGIFGDFTAMVDLMIKMSSTMADLMSSELKEMKQIGELCDKLAQQISATMGLIANMADQINIMANRIVATADLMESLTGDCAS